MRIVCHRCGCSIDMPDNTRAGASLVCPGCGNVGPYTAAPPSPAAAPRKSNHAHVVVLALLIAFCVGSTMAFALPWPMLVVSVLGFLGGVTLLMGKVGRTWRARRPLGIGSMLLSTVFVLLSITAIFAERDQQQRRDARALAEAQAEERRIEALHEESAERLARAREHLSDGAQAVADLNSEPMIRAAELLEPLAELDPPADGYRELQTRIRELNAALARTGAERYLESRRSTPTLASGRRPSRRSPSRALTLPHSAASRSFTSAKPRCASAGPLSGRRSPPSSERKRRSRRTTLTRSRRRPRTTLGWRSLPASTKRRGRPIAAGSGRCNDDCSARGRAIIARQSGSGATVPRGLHNVSAVAIGRPCPRGMAG